MELFKKNKKKTQTQVDREQKEAVSMNRSGTQRVAAVLGQIRFTESADVTGRISQEKMDWYRGTVSALAVQMDQAKILRLDTGAIDQSIQFIAEYLPEAIKSGNEATADRIIKGLAYGISKARKDIPEKDMENASAIVDKRLRRLQMHRDIIELSRKIDELNKALRRQKRTLEEYQGNYEKCKADLKSISSRRPDLVKELDELGFGSNQLSAGAKGIDTARVKVIELSDSIENLSRQIATNESAMQEDEATIRTLEIQMSQTEALVDEATLEDIRKQQEEFQKELLQLERQIDDMEQINKDFTRMMDAVYSSPDMVDRIIRHAMEYESLVEKEARAEEGRRMGLENEAENDQENTRQMN